MPADALLPRYPDLSRADDIVAQHIAVLYHADDVPALEAICRFIGDGLMIVRVEGLALGIDARQPLCFKDRFELAGDELDAGSPGTVCRAILEGALQVIEHGQHALDQVALHDGPVTLAVAVDTLLVVLELGN